MFPGRRPGALLTLLAASTPVAFGASQEARPAALPNLVLVTVDTLRADRLAAYGYSAIATPATDRLAAEGVLLEDAVVQAPQTAPSHASIFTGRLPFEHGVRDNYSPRLAPEIPTLASVLAAHGYDTGAFIGAVPVSARTGLNRGFRVYDDPFSEGGESPLLESERRAAAVVDSALAWLRRPRSVPFFAWVHLYDPHEPYDPPAPFDARYPGRAYDGEVAYADAQIGRLLETLDESGLRSSTLVVVTSDHGEGLGEHGEEEHLLFVYDSTLRVPLLLSWPGVLPVGRRVSGQFRSVDLLPTLLELIGLPSPPVSGESRARALLAGDSVGENGSYAETLYGQIHFGYAPLRALRRGGWKYIDAPRPELYRLDTDPGETRNLVEIEEGIAERLRERLAGYDREGSAAMSSASELGIDAGVMERLAALGYVGSTATGAAAGGVDPKDVIGEFQRRKDESRTAARLMRDGDVEAALPILEGLARGEMISFESLALVGRARLALGRPEQAIEPLRQAMELLPSHPAIHAELAAAYRRAGRPEEARRVVDRGLDVDPDNAVLLEQRGIALYHDGETAGARADLERARELAPASPMVRLALSAIYRDVGDLGGAIRELEQGVEAAPRFAEGWHALGVLRATAGSLPEAIEAFERARELTPDDPDVLFNLAEAHSRSGDPERARPLLERLVRLAPSYPGARPALDGLGRGPAAVGLLRLRVLLAPDRETATDLARRLSAGEEPSGVAKDASGDLGVLGPSDLAEPLREAAASLAPGQVSTPVATPGGFAVLMRLP